MAVRREATTAFGLGADSANIIVAQDDRFSLFRSVFQDGNRGLKAVADDCQNEVHNCLVSAVRDARLAVTSVGCQPERIRVLLRSCLYGLYGQCWCTRGLCSSVVPIGVSWCGILEQAVVLIPVFSDVSQADCVCKEWVVFAHSASTRCLHLLMWYRFMSGPSACVWCSWCRVQGCTQRR